MEALAGAKVAHTAMAPVSLAVVFASICTPPCGGLHACVGLWGPVEEMLPIPAALNPGVGGRCRAPSCHAHAGSDTAQYCLQVFVVVLTMQAKWSGRTPEVAGALGSTPSSKE